MRRLAQEDSVVTQRAMSPGCGPPRSQMNLLHCSRPDDTRLSEGGKDTGRTILARKGRFEELEDRQGDLPQLVTLIGEDDPGIKGQGADPAPSSVTATGWRRSTASPPAPSNASLRRQKSAKRPGHDPGDRARAPTSCPTPCVGSRWRRRASGWAPCWCRRWTSRRGASTRPARSSSTIRRTRARFSADRNRDRGFRMIACLTHPAVSTYIVCT